MQPMPMFPVKSGRSFRDGVDLADAAALRVPDGHARRPGAQMAVVIRPEEDVGNDIAVRDRAEETAHYAKKRAESVIGSMYRPSLYTRMLPEAISSMRMTT